MKILAFWHDINKTFTGPDGNFLSLSPQVGDKSFPLEAVKQLKKIMELDENLGSHSDAHTFKTVCANPLVPQVFRPVCQKDEEVAVFSNLSKKSPKGDQIILVKNTLRYYSVFLSHRYFSTAYCKGYCMHKKLCK